VRYLEEAVAKQLRPDPDRLEEDVMARFAGHTSDLSLCSGWQT
jgi:hypothetical protein